MTRTFVKDRSIHNLMARVAATFSSVVVPTDYWDADLCAVGFTAANAPGRLVYVNTFRRGPGCYSVVLETTDPAIPGDVGINEERGDVDFDGLVSLIREHLLLEQ